MQQKCNFRHHYSDSKGIIEADMNTFLQSVKKFRVLWIVVLLIVVVTFIGDETRRGREDIIYPEALDLVVATVGEEDITLREFALYVAYQEAEVQKQAEVYDPDNTRKYWNVHTDGVFVSHAARNEAMSMAIHDELFYQMAVELKLELSEEEKEILQNDVDDFWYDLTDDGKEEKLGITKDDIYIAMEKIAYAQKAQFICAGIDGVKYSDYDYYEEVFLDFLSDYEYKVYDKVLNRLDFGDITLEHE